MPVQHSFIWLAIDRSMDWLNSYSDKPYNYGSHYEYLCLFLCNYSFLLLIVTSIQTTIINKKITFELAIIIMFLISNFH